MYKAIEQVIVSIWGHKVGYAAYDETRRAYAFSYDPHFIRSGIELSPFHMPLRAGAYIFPELYEATYKGLPALLADSLPDAFGNTLVESYLASKGVDKTRITSLDRLGYANKRGMGALEFKPSTGPRDTKAKQFTAIELASLVDQARRVMHGDLSTGLKALASFHTILQLGTSAGGARAKAVIAWNRETNEIRSGQFDVPDGFEHWIIKFDGVHESKIADPEDHGRVEYAYYLMAKDAGIEMSECRLFEENGRAHFMTKRFDRDGNKKHHLQTLCALDHIDYKQAGTHDYGVLFLAIQRLGLGNTAMEQAFVRMAFNVMASNCDDHAKNFSFILREGRPWALAPAYDLTHAYRSDSQWVFQQFMSVNGTFKDIKRDDLMSVAERFSVPGARKHLDRVRQTISNWKDYAQRAKLPEMRAIKIQRDHKIL